MGNPDCRAWEAVTTILQHLPTAHRRSEAEVLATRFRLADAQSALARESGFASWPNLARHVEQLRSLEGVWSFQRLEVVGTVLPAAGLQMSRLLIDGDRFRTESPEANYEGVFNINVEEQPQEIDIEFVAGPEAGNWNYGIFRLDGDTLDLCLNLNGKPRPAKSGSTPGSGRNVAMTDTSPEATRSAITASMFLYAAGASS
ncbi:MAG: TIGR03067 domain-containing protein [Verrucomicrobia bacterium]|nr:TIGR03067 domain-containing protein [Verrucomicrobiota bacterium]